MLAELPSPVAVVASFSNEQLSEEMEEDEYEHQMGESEHAAAQTPDQTPAPTSAPSPAPAPAPTSAPAPAPAPAPTQYQTTSQSPDGSTSLRSEKLFVGLAGTGVRDFEPRQPAFGKMVDIVRGRYTGIWTSVIMIPQAQKNIWFDEFQKCFYWNVPTNQMKKTFLHQASEHIRNVFKPCRKTGRVPTFIGEKQWKSIERLRKTNAQMLHQAEANKKNRASQKAIDAAVYRGEKDGVKPKISQVVKKLWQTKDGEWTGSRPATYVEQFDRLEATQIASLGSEDVCDAESEQAISELTEKELWIKACDGPRNGRIFALGEEGAALIRTGIANTHLSDSKSSTMSQAFQESQVQPLKEELKEIRSTLQEFMQQQQNQQKEFMQ